MALWVKDPALSLLRHGFNPWHENFGMPQVWPKKKKKSIPSVGTKERMTYFNIILKIISFIFLIVSD